MVVWGGLVVLGLDERVEGLLFCWSAAQDQHQIAHWLFWAYPALVLCGSHLWWSVAAQCSQVGFVYGFCDSDLRGLGLQAQRCEKDEECELCWHGSWTFLDVLWAAERSSSAVPCFVLRKSLAFALMNFLECSTLLAAHPRPQRRTWDTLGCVDLDLRHPSEGVRRSDVVRSRTRWRRIIDQMAHVSRSDGGGFSTR